MLTGSNANQELGVPTGDEKEVSAPQIVQLPGNLPVRMIACGFEHSACITMDERAFSWGSGLLGILGHQSDINRDSPTEIDLHWNDATTADARERLVWVACGPHNTGIVCQGRADKRQIYTWGAGDQWALASRNHTPSESQAT
jgi:alpha-tubulin suppressor-like RCC1 family protein